MKTTIKKIMKSSNYFILGFFLILMISSCKKDTVQEENDEEIITTLSLKFTPVGGGAAVTYSYDDADGPGGNAPVKQTISLAANKQYQVELSLLNKTTNPVTDITTEILAEADAHRFYFAPSASANISVGNLNNDGNGVPLGTTGTLSTTTAANGKLLVTLRHYPGNPPNKAVSDPVNSSKSGTDIEVEFDTVVL